MRTIHRGNAVEAAVLAALTAADIPVLLPFGQGLAFDLAAVIPPDGDIIRIQVKSGRLRKGCVEFNACATDHGSGRRPYAGRADIIAVHLPEPHRLFMVPVDACPSYKGYLRVEASRNNQQRRIRLAAKYEFGGWVCALRQPGAGDAVV